MSTAQKLFHRVLPDPRDRVLILATHVVPYASPNDHALADNPRLEILVAYCGLQGAESRLDPETDALNSYAVADAYVSPTREDGFALPPLEAMACGPPIVTSLNNRGSQIITDGVDGFVLKDQATQLPWQAA